MNHRPNPGIYVEPAEVASWILGAFVVGLLAGAAVGVWLG